MAVGRELDYDVNDILGNQSLGGFTDENLFGEDTLDPTNSLLLGATQRTSTAFGRAATVKAGEDIRPALESLKSAGGGTLILLAGVHKPTYNIVGDSKINIVGEGREQTVVDFSSGSYNFQYIGVSGTPKTGFIIRDLTVKNSGASYGIQLEWCDFWLMSNVQITNCSGVGFYVNDSSDWITQNCYFDNNTGDGLRLYGDGEFDGCFRFTINTCTSDSNGGDGFAFDTAPASGGTQADFSLINLISVDNTTYGYDLTNATNGSLIGCRATNNGDAQYLVAGSNSRFVACSSFKSGDNGFEVTGSRNVFVGCGGQNLGSGDLFSVTGSDNVVIGSSAITTALSDSMFSFDNERVIASLNFRETPRMSKDIKYMKNSSGGALSAGDVSVLSAATTAEELTTTTTQGDDYVFGVFLESVSNGNRGHVLVEGFTNVLKVNGATAISVGDFLGTYTSAGISMKAAAGDMAFAIAMEAYSTADSNGVIDALIIKPRKI